MLKIDLLLAELEPAVAARATVGVLPRGERALEPIYRRIEKNL